MNTKTTIIFLNGVGSVGKTAIAKALQAILTKAYLHVGVDQFIDMLPDKLIGDPQGITFETLQKDNHPLVKIHMGTIGATAMKGMRHAIAALANQGNNLIIDEVTISNEMEEYKRLLSAHQVYYVGVFAALAIIEERELKRQDRLIGLARWQYDRVHQNKVYDLTVDTSMLSPLECAEIIKTNFKL